MISLCMIVKDEIKHLEKCIKSVQEHLGDFVNEYIVVDTGSTDETVELAKKLNCTVDYFEWCNDFSKARNYSISIAKNNWILVLDADEIIIKVDKTKLKEFCSKKNEDYYGIIDIQNITSDGYIDSTNEVSRVFNKKIYEFKNIIHEQLVRKDKKEFGAFKLDLVVEHTGYISEIVKEKNKHEKYIKLLLEHLKSHPNDFYMITQLGIIYKQEEKFEEAMEVTSKVVFNDDCTAFTYYICAVNTYLSSLINLEQYQAGLVFEKFWDYCCEDDRYVYSMANIYMECKMFEKALDALLICVNRKNSNMDKRYAYYPLGGLFEIFGELEQALFCYKKCGDYSNAKSKVIEIEKLVLE